MTLDNVQALPPGTMLGDYRLDTVIGHGGFGITYRAFDSQLAKVVAIKEYLPVEFAVREGQNVVARGARFAEDFAWGRERFLDEARALARFRHSHIVPVMRFLEGNGTAYTVMEFEDGRNVAELLREPGRRLPPDEVRRLAEGLLLGLDAVHAQGFLHRDIKPSNIIIRRDGVPVLIDFGAARQAMGNRTRAMTSVLTPQYAPIEQYTVGGNHGPWSDIYSAAAVLYHAIAGRPPPEAAGRVGTDSYQPLANTQAARFDRAFLEAVDRGLAFAPAERPQSITDWSKLFGVSLARAHDAPTQRMDAAPVLPGDPAPRLGGVSRETSERVVLPKTVSPRRAATPWILLALALVAGGVVWQYAPPLFGRMSTLLPSGTQSSPDPSAEASAPASMPAPTAIQPPSATLAPAPPAPVVSPEQKQLQDLAQRAAASARAVFEKAKEASGAARTMAGEARIAAARAARPGLENAERITADDGASYVGQTADGKRQGLGVLEFKDGDRQAGEWKNNILDGLGIERLSDGPRYEGQWSTGLPAGLGVREKPGRERAEGNFAVGQLEGLGTRRILSEPTLTQTGEFHGDTLDGLGIETLANGERYEGAFRAGKRHGFGLLIGPDERARASRWDDGKLVESMP
ncbi:MAG: protein kinase [Enhydrobacter sp.]|nr:protein kinase [Enhydrobacter sp.]